MNFQTRWGIQICCGLIKYCESFYFNGNSTDDRYLDLEEHYLTEFLDKISLNHLTAVTYIESVRWGQIHHILILV